MYPNRILLPPKQKWLGMRKSYGIVYGFCDIGWNFFCSIVVDGVLEMKRSVPTIVR